MTAFAQAWRALLRRRLFTLTTVATLPLGIAVTTTVFSIVHGVMVRPLPFPDGDQLVALYEASPGRRERTSLIAPGRLEDWNRMATRFEVISGSYRESVADTSGAEPERLDGRRVAPRFFDVFGMPPLAGRTFVAEEERFGGRTAVVISEGLWARRFNRSPASIGARLIVGGTPARPIFGAKLLTEVMEATLDQPRQNASLLVTFAAAALGPAALGLYGLLSLLVAERRRELGVRIALGASPRDLVRVIVLGAGRLVAGGVAIGCALLLAAGFLLRALLFGVTPTTHRRWRGASAHSRSPRWPR